MKWVVIVLGILVGLVVLVVLIGALVPRNHVAGSSAALRQPPESVWRVVRDLGGVPQWWSQMKTAERAAGPDARERWTQGMGGFQMTLVIEVDEPPRRLVTRIESPPGAPFGGTWTYDITPTPGGTKVTVTERGWIANPIFRFMSRFIFGYHGTQVSYLRALGRKFGETVTPEREPGGS